MRLGKPRGGGGTVTTTITLEPRALKESGCFPWSSYGYLSHCVSIKEGGGAPGNYPGYAPLFQTLTSSNAHKRLIL